MSYSTMLIFFMRCTAVVITLFIALFLSAVSSKKASSYWIENCNGVHDFASFVLIIFLLMGFIFRKPFPSYVLIFYFIFSVVLFVIEGIYLFAHSDEYMKLRICHSTKYFLRWIEKNDGYHIIFKTGELIFSSLEMYQLAYYTLLEKERVADNDIDFKKEESKFRKKTLKDIRKQTLEQPEALKEFVQFLEAQHIQ